MSRSAYATPRMPGTSRTRSTGMGRRAVRLQMDVRKLEQVREAVAGAAASFGRLDILVNNAGLGPPNPAEDVSEADYDLTFDVNVKGTFFASQAAARVMIPQGFGRIVNLSSQAGFVALPTESVYGMTKAAIAHLTKCLAVEWGVHQITVNAVAPTFIRTPGTEKWLADPAFERDLVERIAGVHRVGEPSTLPARSCSWPRPRPRSSPARPSWSTVAGRLVASAAPVLAEKCM